jgi:antitoxin MazE
MGMKTAVQRWGNSLAVRIPRAFARETRLGSGTEVDLRLQSGMLVISRASKNHYRLTELLALARKTNAHSETEWGGPKGGEVW